MSGVANMAAGLNSLNKLRSAIKSAPLRIRSSVAKDAAEVLNARMRDDFAAGRTVYGEARPVSKVTGEPLSLVKSGRTKGALGFTAIGTILRASLPTKHAKYLIGKYAVLPRSPQLPAAWQADLAKTVREHLEDFEREALR